MSEQKIEVGDIVVLKSGGPKMTVDVMSGLGAECLWFDAQNNGPIKGRFSAASLRKQDDPAE